MSTSKPAQGQRGFLIRGMDGQIWFRQYSADHEFVDYDITHYDCEIEIVDDSAELISNEHGDFLDYTKQALGIDCNGFCGEYECKENQANCKRLRK